MSCPIAPKLSKPKLISVVRIENVSDVYELCWACGHRITLLLQRDIEESDFTCPLCAAERSTVN